MLWWRKPVSDLLEILQSKKVSIPETYDQFKNIIRVFRGKQGTIGDFKVKQDKPVKLFDDPELFYLVSPEKGFLPGDILGDLPPIWLDSGSNEDIKIKKSASSKFMIVSTECDCELRDDGSHMSFVRICPVYDENEIESHISSSNDLKQIMGNLQSNSFVEYFWVPKMEKSGNGHFADLSHIFSINIETLHHMAAKEKITRICSLTETAFFLLQLKLAWFFLDLNLVTLIEVSCNHINFKCVM